MDENKVIEVEAKLREAVSAAQADGYSVEPGTWGLTQENPETRDGLVWRPRLGGCLCPMACVAIGQNIGPYGWNPEYAASQALGISEREVANFIVGFDAAECDSDDYDEDEFYALGKSFRKVVL